MTNENYELRNKINEIENLVINLVKENKEQKNKIINLENQNQHQKSELEKIKNSYENSFTNVRNQLHNKFINGPTSNDRAEMESYISPSTQMPAYNEKSNVSPVNAHVSKQEPLANFVMSKDIPVPIRREIKAYFSAHKIYFKDDVEIQSEDISCFKTTNKPRLTLVFFKGASRLDNIFAQVKIMGAKFNNNYIIIICNDEDSSWEYDKDFAQKYGSGWSSGSERRHVMFQLRYRHDYGTDTAQVNLNISPNAESMSGLIKEITSFASIKTK